jgi:hypothetical protein
MIPIAGRSKTPSDQWANDKTLLISGYGMFTGGLVPA